MIYLQQIKGEEFKVIENLSTNSVRIPMRLNQVNFGEQRNYKVTISISCSGPQSGKVKPSKLKILRKREAADLDFTTNDADWMYRWNKKQFNKKAYDSGRKEKHIRLVNPTLEELKKAFIAAGQYLKSYKNRKDWNGGEILIIYAGHGLEGDGALYISGLPLTAKEMINQIVTNLPLTNKKCRIDVMLDSCYSGAFIAYFLFEAHQFEDKIFPFELFGSCLYDETSLESHEWQHGILTHAFQQNQVANPFEEPNDDSLFKWQEQVKSSLFQGGVVYLSEGEQHAFNLRNGDLKVYGSTHFFNIFEESKNESITLEDLFGMMDKQKNEVNLIDFNKPYTKEMFAVLA